MYKNLAAALAAACLLSPVYSQGVAPAAPDKPTRAAWVYVTPITPAGWTHQHELGRQAVQKALGKQVVTSYVENVAEGPDAERVIRDLARQGNDIIFTTSFGYMEPTLKVAREFPQVKFESITGYKQADNVATANARDYEGRYLAGIAAGRMTTSGVDGYVAGFPIPEVLQGINAFTLGLRSVAPQAQLAAVTHHWGDYDVARVRAVRAGSWKSGDTWGGVKQGMVRIEAFGPKVPQAVRSEVLARQNDIAAGRLLPFAGPVVDNTGKVQVAKGQSASDAQILKMDYLVEGVQGALPR